MAEPGAREAERDERAHLGPLEPDRARLGQRRVRGVLGQDEVAEQHLHARALLEHAGALGAVAGRQQRRGAVERAEAVAALAGLADELAEPSVELSGAQRLGPSSTASIALRVSAIARVVSPREPAHVAALRSASAMSIPARSARVGDAIPELEHALEVTLRRLVGVHALGGEAGRGARAERAAQVVGGLPVARELGGHRGVGRLAQHLRPRLDRAGDRRVQGGVLARQQVAVDRLADQRVAEPVLVAGVDHQHLVRDRLARAVHHLGGREAGDRFEQLVPGGTIEHGDDADDRSGGVRQLLDAGEQDVAQRLGQHPALAVLERRQQLLGVERVALGARVEPVGELVRRRLLQDAGELLAQLGAVEPLEREPVDAGGPLELGQHRPQRMAPVQLVGAIRDDQAQRLLARAAHEERDEVARRAVRPVQVLDRQQHRARAPEPVEQREQRLEQPALARARLLVGAGADAAELGQQLGEGVAGRRRQCLGLLGREPARERPQGAHQRRVRDLRAAELQALAEQHARALLPRAGLELAQEPGLADARLAAHERERRAPGPGALERRAQQLELGAATDERGGADAAGHQLIVAHRAR